MAKGMKNEFQNVNRKKEGKTMKLKQTAMLMILGLVSMAFVASHAVAAEILTKEDFFPL